MAAIEKSKDIKNAFTLVELLVVISIIAILLAVLMPSLRIAREQAKRVYCLSNLKQMSLAANSYVNSNDGFFPISHWFDQNKSYGWDYIADNSTGKLVSGLLWQGDTIDKVNQCPSYKGTDNWSADGTYTGYNYNTSYIGHGQGENITTEYSGKVKAHPVWPAFYNIVIPARANQIKNTGNCALFGDGHYSGGANKMMRSPFLWHGDKELSIRIAGTQGYRHIEKTNVAWADGHASSQKEIYTKSYDLIRDRSIDMVSRELEEYNQNAKIKIGFLSPDNSAYDLK